MTGNPNKAGELTVRQKKKESKKGRCFYKEFDEDNSVNRQPR